MSGSDSSVISVLSRESVGKGAARATRRSGLVPSVIYGGGKPSVSVAIDPRIVVKGLESGHFFSTVYSVEIGENKETEKAIVRDIQFDPVTDFPLHVDFMRVTDRTKVTISVPVVFRGDDVCPGLKAGGLLSIVRHDVEVSCRASDIPDELVCDISEAEIGDTLKISSIPLPAGVVPTISDRDFVIANVLAPKLVEVVDDDAPADAEAVDGEADSDTKPEDSSEESE